MKSIDLEFKRCCRNAGGLSLGVNYHFPVTIVTDFVSPEYAYDMHMIIIGFVFWQLTITIICNKRNNLP